MPNPQNIVKHKFPKGISGNPNGRPKKLVTLLRDQGYKQIEVEDTIRAMLAMDLDELRGIWDDPKATILEKTIANAMRRSMEKGTLYSIEVLLTRVYGKPREQLHQTTEGKIEVVFVQGRTIL